MSPNPAYALLPQSLLFSNVHSKMTGGHQSSRAELCDTHGEGSPDHSPAQICYPLDSFLFCSRLIGPPVFNFTAAYKLLQREGAPRLLQRAEDRQKGTVRNDQEYAESKGTDSQQGIFGMVKRRDRRLRSWAQYQDSFQTSLASELP